MLNRIYGILLILLGGLPLEAHSMFITFTTTPSGPGRMSITVNAMKFPYGGWWKESVPPYTEYTTCADFVIIDSVMEDPSQVSYPEGSALIGCYDSVNQVGMGQFDGRNVTLFNVRSDMANGKICVRATHLSPSEPYLFYGCERLQSTPIDPPATACVGSRDIILNHGQVTLSELSGHKTSAIFTLDCTAAVSVQFIMSGSLIISGIGESVILLNGKNVRFGPISSTRQGLNLFTVESILPETSNVSAGTYTGSGVLTINYL